MCYILIALFRCTLMEIYFKVLGKVKATGIPVGLKSTVQEVIDEACSQGILLSNTDKLIYEGKQLHPSRTLEYYNIQDNSILTGIPHTGNYKNEIVVSLKKRKSLVIHPMHQVGSFRSLSTSGFHISEKSDKFYKHLNYVGACFWGTTYGQNEWKLNGINCQSGFIILKRTSKIQKISCSEGRNHSKLFNFLFECSPFDSRPQLVGTGFTIEKGEWKWNSYTFNETTKWKKHTKDILLLEQYCIKKAIAYWIHTGNTTVRIADIPKSEHCIIL